MSKRLSVISLFSGGLGLDLGLEEAGFEIRVAVECNKFAAKTIRENRPQLELIEKRIEVVPTKEILKRARLKKGEATVVIGGPSCQAFSTAGQRGSVSDPRGGMFREFLRVVKEARPRFFIMENVRGVLSAAVKHRPLNKRGPGFPSLTGKEELGSALKMILDELRGLGYYVVFDVVNTADYGVAQARERVLFIGSRDGEPIEIPKRSHAKAPLPGSGMLPWVSLREGLKGLRERKPIFNELSPKNKKLLALVPEGGNWRDLPKAKQKKALGRAYDSWGGRVGFFRRLAWGRPSPALTTRPDSKATMFCHPTELRTLSIGEYSRLQGFPKEWSFAGGPAQQYIQIGNAVPVKLGAAAGRAIRDAMRRKIRVETGVIRCASQDLLNRMARRPLTVLNPPRMRRHKKVSTARKWLAGRTRDAIFTMVSGPQLAAARTLRRPSKKNAKTSRPRRTKKARHARR